MSVPNSPIDIANIAVDLIGDRYITSIEEPETATAEIISRNYDNIRQATLREFIWPFAKKTQILAPSITHDPTYGTSFPMPIDLLRLLQVWGGTHRKQMQPFEIEVRNINVHGHPQAITIQYIFDAVDVTTFDPCFVQILGIRLAVRAAQRITLKPSVTKMLQETLKIELIKAVSISGQENRPKRIEYSRAASARQGWQAYPNGNNQFVGDGGRY